MAANSIQVWQSSQFINLPQILGEQCNRRFGIRVYSLDTAAQLPQKIDHRTRAKPLQVSNIRAERTTHRAKAGHIWPTRLIDQYAIDRKFSQVLFHLVEEPAAKRFMIETGDIVIAPMAIHDPRVRMVKSIPARHERWTSKQVAIASKTQVHLQACILRLAQPTFQVTRPALRLLLMYGVNDTPCPRGPNLVKVMFYSFCMVKGVKISNGNIHSTCQK